MIKKGTFVDMRGPWSEGILEKLYELAFQMTPVGMSFVTLDRRGLYCNPALCYLLGRSAEELSMIDIGSITHPEDRNLHVELHRQLLAGEIEQYSLDKRYVHKGGHIIWAHLEVVLVGDDISLPRMLLSQVSDIGHRVAMSDQLLFLASHDVLTGLGNRSELFAQIDRANQRDPTSVPIAILYLDMDDFKSINDMLGHAMGDRALVHVAEQIRGVLGPEDFAARIGGDEFVVVAKHQAIAAYASNLAKQILECLSVPVHWDGHRLKLSASIGIAFASHQSPDAILSLADDALYLAKRNGKNRSVISE
ncbi:MAG: sensor domain-containing diguanylate cyclase [Proteobacteria bacterium]|nr:MAG: sensor domain-containing diguanylate cyclase [Pseudomonadota bacterium]